ncbi:hypothetical protein JZ751_022139 [Albula glossodonta]|uniref:Uncharacterized protein n=1 Tax=Albula glossodonta TaxID=121402 RepID=A0A8T2NR42_9TELE|nr:hypothetical protein JZ751_022139 [Albula glossodonta]
MNLWEIAPFQNALNDNQVRPLLHLSVADFLASAVLLCTSALNFVSPSTLLHSINICERCLPLALTFYCISFLLVIVYAFESKRAVQGWRERTEEGQDEQVEHHSMSEDRERGRLLLVYAIVWLGPITMYFVYICTVSLMEGLIQRSPGDTGSNEAMSNDHRIFCTSCILLLHIGNDTCPHVVGSWYRRYQERGMFLIEGDGFGRRHLRGLYSTPRSMMLVIIICWTPAFILVSLSFTGWIHQEKLFPLYVIQALTVSLQGLLDSIVYGWLRRNFREAALGERMPLLATPPKAFYDESLPMTLTENQ